MKKYLGNKAMIILFIAPVMLFMIVMVFYPLVVLVRNSFTTWDGLNPATFNGIKNYVRLFKDPLFYTGLKNGIIYAAIQTCYQIPIATLLAFAVKSVSKGEKKFFRIAYYIPAVLSVTVVCQLWVAIYDADYGLINKIFEALGLCREQVRLRLRRGGAAGRAEPDRLVLRQQVHRARADHLLRWRIWEKSLLSVQSCSGYFFIFMLLSVSIP